MSDERAVITEEMFADWLQHPVTELLRGVLAGKLQARKDEWAEGHIINNPSDTQLMQNAAAIGECKALKMILEMDFETMKGEIESEK